MSKPIYALFYEVEFGEKRWILCAPNSSPTGRYDTRALAEASARRSGLKVERRPDFDRDLMKNVGFMARRPAY
jgi:hypothetical protein